MKPGGPFKAALQPNKGKKTAHERRWRRIPTCQLSAVCFSAHSFASYSDGRRARPSEKHLDALGTLFQPFTMSSALILFAMLRSSAANSEVKWARMSGGGGCTYAQANAMNLVRVSVSLLRDEVDANQLDFLLGEAASYCQVM